MDEPRETPEVEEAGSTQEPGDGEAAEISAAEPIDGSDLENASGGSGFGWWNEPPSD